MGKRLFFLTIALCLPSCLGHAELRDIDRSKLPSAALEVYNAVLPIEPMVKHWNPKWPYKKPSQKEVVSTMKGAIAQMEGEKRKNATNEEVLLLLGVVAQYGHNVDIDGAAQLAIDAYSQGHVLAPKDFRPDWFLGEHKCEAGLVTEGMQMLLDVEKRRTDLPSTFWDDYLTCATVSAMPVHALHATQMIRKQGMGLSDRQAQIEQANTNRFLKLIPDKEYPSDEIWSVDKKGSDRVDFTAEVCGLRFSIPSSWGVNLLPTRNSQCAAVMQTGPYKTPGGEMYPNIALIARPAKGGESLEDFSKSLRGDNPSKASTAPACPVATCIEFESVKDGGYNEAGDARAIFVAFESREPEMSGLKLEIPQGPPKGESDKVRYFRPRNRYSRSSGTYYYQVLLDTASSMDEQAMKDLMRVLRSFEVE